MYENSISRRRFMKDLTLAGGVVLAGSSVAGAGERSKRNKLHVACNSYSWLVFYRREGRDLNKELDAALGDLVASGLDGYEPSAGNPQDLDRLGPLLKKHGVEMRSLYVNSTLYEREKAEQSIESVLAIASKAKTLGTKIIVTNPSPIRWGGPQNKNDAQLKIQAKALEKLGRQLKTIGLTLAYHNHDMELREAAREFHHMMVGTDPAYVTFCLDAHWIYRGTGNSQVALFDVVELYGSRITELHLRQSHDGIWAETMCDGDIDYRALAKRLLEIGVRPHIVLEQAVEKGTPKTMSPVEAFRKSSKYTREVFAVFA